MHDPHANAKDVEIKRAARPFIYVVRIDAGKSEWGKSGRDTEFILVNSALSDSMPNQLPRVLEPGI
jgi:hypothetical protein